MNKNVKRVIYLIVLIVPSIIIYYIGESTILKYKESVENHKLKLSQYAKNTQDKEMQLYISSKKENGEKWVDNMMLVFADKYKASQVNVKEELQKTVDIAYSQSHKIAKKYKNPKKYTKTIAKEIKLKLSKIKGTGELFLTDYSGNNLFGLNEKEDINVRTILLEQIQKVRRRGGGYIVSDVDYIGTQRHIVVKDLGINKLFIGADIYVNNQNKELKNNLLDIVKNTLLQENDCVRVSQSKKNIYSSLGCKSIQNATSTYSSYFEPIDWTLTYSFDASKKREVETQKLNNFESQLKLD